MRDPIVVEVEADIEDLIPMFLEQRRKDQTVMTQALAAGDLETLRVIGHGMAGAGSSYGFNQITAIGEAMERAARARDLAELKTQAALLADYMDRVVVTYV